MIVHDVTQGSPEWLKVRLGMPTTSRFDKIITAKTLKYSRSAEGYRNELLAERVLGQPLGEWDGNDWTTRGTTLEAEAVRYYSFQTDRDVEAVGFVTDDDGRYGCSPDRLIVGEPGGLEIKCYGAKHHVACLLGEDPVTRTQAQGQIWVCEWEWVDQLAYQPKFPPVLIRTERDDKFIKALSDAMDRFLDELVDGQRILDALGKQGRTDSLERLLVAT
jgi:hypothetical protein